MKLLQSDLIKILINKMLITHDMLVEGKVLARSLSRNVQLVTKELLIVDIGKDSFRCRDRLGLMHTMQFGNVQTVDGMELSRFAAVYNIKTDGSPKNIGKKRGRKPKSAQINTHEGELHGENKRTTDYSEAKQAFA